MDKDSRKAPRAKRKGFEVFRFALCALLFAISVPAAFATDTGAQFFARVYLSETEAVALQKDRVEDRVEARELVLSETQAERIKREQRVRMYTHRYRVYELFAPGETVAYRRALPLQEPGQHEYLDVMYGINADGTIHRIDLLVYREPYGGEVAGRRFMRQFEGKSLANSRIRVNMDVIHIVGATISAHSVANAARRALGIMQVDRGQGTGDRKIK